jgi:type I restriction enzyme S subunit
MKVTKPPLDLIESFNGKVDGFLEQVKVLQRQIRNLRRTRDLLLPRLLSGQINVEAAEHV